MAFRLLKNILAVFAILVVVISSLIVVYIVNLTYSTNIEGYNRSSQNYKLFFFNKFERSNNGDHERDISKGN